MKNYHENFASIEAFSLALRERELNSVFKEAGKEYSKKVRTDDKQGTATYEDADNLLLYGDVEIAGRLITNLGGIKIFDWKETPKRVHDVTGFGVNVGRALSGSAKCMNRRKAVADDGKIIDIYINSTVPWYIKSKQIEEKLCELFSVINLIEKRGVQTNIYTGCASKSNGQTLSFVVKIKSAGQPFNIVRYAYPLTSPGMLRRHFIRFIETIPEEIKFDFTKGHGHPTSFDSVLFLNGSDFVFSLWDEIEKKSTIEDIKKAIENCIAKA